jgi:hypothetical protein
MLGITSHEPAILYSTLANEHFAFSWGLSLSLFFTFWTPKLPGLSFHLRPTETLPPISHYWRILLIQNHDAKLLGVTSSPSGETTSQTVTTA